MTANARSLADLEPNPKNINPTQRPWRIFFGPIHIFIWHLDWSPVLVHQNLWYKTVEQSKRYFITSLS